MDCVNCAVTIDGDLEDIEGVKKAQTNYAKAQTAVTFDPKKVSEKRIIERIKEAGYNAKPVIIN